MGTPYEWLASNTWGIFQANFTFPGPVGHGQITSGYGSHGSPGPINPQADSETIKTILAVNLMPLLHSGCVLTSVHTVLNVGGSVEEGLSTSAGVAGSQTEVLTLPSACVLVKKETGLIGKTNRGRWYVPGIGGDQIDNTTGAFLTGAAQTAWNAAMAALPGVFTAAELELSLVRKTTNPTLYRYVALTKLVTEVQLSEQTRRNRRVAHR